MSPLAAGYVLAGCHSLIAQGGRLLGDPMEKAALQAAGWAYSSDGFAHRTLPLEPEAIGLSDVAPPHSLCQPRLRVLKRYPFSSDLKRSAALVHAEMGLVGSYRADGSVLSKVASAAAAAGVAGLLAVVKGSPEAIRAMLTSVPDGYDATYLHYASSGKRVLALATKAMRSKRAGAGGGEAGSSHSMPTTSASSAAASSAAAEGITREEVEFGLTFCGFLVLHCPPRSEAKEVLTALSTSGHTLQMLTGDNLLTATHTATALGLATKPALLLELCATSDDDAASATATGAATPAAAAPPPPTNTLIERYIATHAAKPSSDATSASATTQPLSSQPPQRLQWRVWTAGAVSAPPTPLEDASRVAFRDLARRYDLCVGGDAFAALHARGALPAALPYLRVMARMKPGQKEVALQVLRECGLVTMMCGDGTNDVGALRQSSVSVALVSTSLVAAPPPPRSADAKAPKSAAARDMSAGAPSVKLGDASIAAAFTARSASPSSCVDVITQGRCTLVTTTQMFKILSTNCLVSAYALSVLHHQGVRMSDTQATATGLATAALFLFVSFSQPLPQLAARRPPPSALAPSVMLSVLGQFLAHLHTVIKGFQLASAAGTDDPPPEADAEFEPSLTNTAMFLLTMAMMLTTFGVNYTGRPHMASLASNKGLAGTLVVGAALSMLLTLNALPWLTEYLELVPLPQGPTETGLPSDLLSLMALDFGICFITEKGTSRLFRY